MTFSEAAVEVLRLVGRPMHFKKITQVAIAKNLLSHVGKTPEVTMSARLAAVVGKDRGDMPIVRTKSGVFALREWGDKAPNGGDVGENDAFAVPGAEGEPKAKGRGKAAKGKAEEAPKEKDKDKRKKDGKESGRGRRGRKAEVEAAEPAEAPAAAPPAEEETAEFVAPRVAEAAPASEHDEDADGEDLDDDEGGEGDGDARAPAGASSSDGRPARPEGEGGGRRRRRRRRRRGGERIEGGTSAGPIVEVRSRNGSSVVLPGGRDAVALAAGEEEPLPASEEASETTASGAYPIVGSEPDDGDLLGEVMAEREEERERIPRPIPPREHDRRNGGRDGRDREARDRDGRDRDGRERDDRRRDQPRELPRDLPPPGEQTLADGLFRLLHGQERSGGVPIRQLADQAVRGQLLPADSAAPWMVVGAALRADTHKRALAGVRPRFRALSGSRWALFEWGVGGEALRLENETNQLADKQREASRKTLLRRLVDMGDPQFEHLVLILVDRLGYERPRRINRGGGRELHMAASTKHGPGGISTALVFSRTGREIDPARVAELRGALHHYGAAAGWILTTGSVSAAAREEGLAAGAPPIGLTDAAGLGRLFEDMGVGICKSRVELAYLDVELLDALKNG